MQEQERKKYLLFPTDVQKGCYYYVWIQGINYDSAGSFFNRTEYRKSQRM